MSDCDSIVEIVHSGSEVTIEVSSATVEVVSSTCEVEVVPALVEVETWRGPKGDKGDPGEGAAALEVEAGENLSALQPIVVIDDLAYAADSSDASHYGRVVGIASTAATSGNNVTIKTDGARIQDAFFDFDGGLVYVGPAGTLTETPPASGFCQSIATAVASDALIVQLGPPIRRA